MRLSKFIPVLALVAPLLAGCGGDDVEVYRVSKSPEARAGLPHDHPPVGGGEAPKSQGARDIHWKTPPGWGELPGTGMRHATFVIGEGSARAEMSVVALRGAGGGLLPNVNRWRRQLGLGPFDDKTFAKESLRVASPAGEAIVVDLRGTDERILGAVLDAGGGTWFFKLRGPDKTVGAAKETFLGFLSGLHYSGGGKK